MLLDLDDRRFDPLNHPTVGEGIVELGLSHTTGPLLAGCVLGEAQEVEHAACLDRRGQTLDIARSPVVIEEVKHGGVDDRREAPIQPIQFEGITHEKGHIQTTLLCLRPCSVDRDSGYIHPDNFQPSGSNQQRVLARATTYIEDGRNDLAGSLEIDPRLLGPTYVPWSPLVDIGPIPLGPVRLRPLFGYHGPILRILVKVRLRVFVTCPREFHYISARCFGGDSLASRPALRPDRGQGRTGHMAKGCQEALQLERMTGVMNIYVGNLPFTTTAADLETLFGEYGAVDNAAIINDRETGRSRGFGFVEMANDAGAKAIEELDGADYNGRNLKVNEARPREERGPRR